ncbi:MAG: dockerin type I domain-containing protein [Ruminococcus sp.]
MKRRKRILTATCTAAVLTGVCSMPTFAAGILAEGKPIPQLLEEMAQDTNSYFLETSAGMYHYLTEDNFYAIELTKKYYTIQLEQGLSLPKDAAAQLGKAICLYGSTDPVPVTEGAPNITNHYVNGASLEDFGDGTYQLVLSKYCEVDETALITYFQTIPGFASITYGAAGYELTDSSLNLNYDFEGSEKRPTDGTPITLDIQTTENIALTAEDFAESLGVVSVESVSNGTAYRISLDPELYQKMTRSEMLQLVKQIEVMEQVETVDLHCQMNELAYAAVNEPIDNGAIPYVTRGDCNETETIDPDDAYLALRHYAADAVGGESTLSDRNRCAADVNGNGTVDADDAYFMLKYYAAKSVGSDAQWSDILQ